ncbi:DUF262 domain-containing protein [Daejeonella oryzae]|uniref:DUF262 domain-containing protein n=1 Tax=Daejeonella oryzae TaxID=1122943 RepID=UPI0003FCCFD4|nr:DUF262 domain-containing protein [Daejeonella oryzae]
MKNYDIEEERIGEETENDIQNLSKESFSEAVLWSTDWTTETIVSQLKKGNIELSPNFQRRDAWGSDRKSKFIESIILGLPIPQIILAERKDKRGSYIVIDGKQRLLSIRQFASNDVNDEFEPLKLVGLKVLDDLNGKVYSQLIAEIDYNNYITAFENQTIRTIIIRNWPNHNFLYTVFLRLNTGSLPLSPQELRQALNPGLFTSFADAFSAQNEEIKRALKIKKPDYRMRDVEVVVRFFAFKNYIDTYTGNLKEFLDGTCEKLNREYIKSEKRIHDQANELTESIKATYLIFEENAFSKFSDGTYTGIFNRPVYDIMSYYFSIPEIRDEAVRKRQDVKKLFESLCTHDIDFLRSLETSTKNIEPTMKRYNTWGTKLKDVLQKEFKIPTKTDDGIKLL